MLRDERQAQVNDLLVACKATADDYEQAAEIAESSALAQFLRATASYRWELAELLARHVRDLHDLPREPDPDRQLFEHALTRLKAALHLSGDDDIVSERCRDDRELLELARVTEGLELPASVREAVVRTRAHVEATLDALPDEKCPPR